MTQFGGGKSAGTCLIYENKDYKLKYEPKWRLRRENLADAKSASKTRKTRKNIKIKTRKLRGKAKVKVMNA
jgi:ribosomal protein S24E